MLPHAEHAVDGAVLERDFERAVGEIAAELGVETHSERLDALHARSAELSSQADAVAASIASKSARLEEIRSQLVTKSARSVDGGGDFPPTLAAFQPNWCLLQ